jgi:hypothetical protein
MRRINTQLCFFNIAEKTLLVEKGAIFFIIYLFVNYAIMTTSKSSKPKCNKVQQHFDILPSICYSAFILTRAHLFDVICS